MPSIPTPVAGSANLFRFVMSDEDVLALAALSKPRLLTLEDPRTAQECSNAFWSTLGDRMGFDVTTVTRDPKSADPGTFLAVPVMNDYNKRMAIAKAAVEKQDCTLISFEITPDGLGVATCSRNSDSALVTFEQRPLKIKKDL